MALRLTIEAVSGPTLWDKWVPLWPLLEPAYERSDERADILAGVLSGYLQLWQISAINGPTAGICTKLLREQTSSELHCHVWLVGGSHLMDWAGDFIEKLKPWAKSEGCCAITGNGRRGWARIVPKLGFRRIEDRDGLPCWRLDL